MTRRVVLLVTSGAGDYIPPMSVLLAIDTAAPRLALAILRDGDHVETLIEDMATGQAGDWTFGSLSEGSAVDILDRTGTELAVGDIAVGTEVVNLKGSAAQELTLNAADVLNIAEGDVLHIVGGKEDTLNVTGDGWTAPAGDQASHFGWVQLNNTNGATLLVDPDVNVNLMG